jgi:K+-sensing histidine kinase KdpD
MFLTYILISNYKNVLNEKTRWGLEKESHFFQEVEEMKTNFLSLFSHDLKTPLAKIIGISDTLRSQIKDPEILIEIEKIHTSSKDLEKYIQRILKMSQVQSKNVSLNKTPEDINTIIEKSIAQNRFSAEEKNIRLEKNLSPLFMIEMDGGLIQEVIINFIENAITYSPEGTTIKISSEEINEYVKVSVKDEGQGVPKEAQENIWDKYYRFDGKNTGYGLGLFLSRYVVDLHGGQVFLNSKKNQGSEFGFILPINEDES